MELTVAHALLLFVAGIGSGLVGYLAGLASLISYPALLAVGIPPLTANATNTISMLGSGFGSAVKAGSKLAETGRRRLIQQAVIAIVGGASGGIVLLVTGEDVFVHLVPWLVALASLLLLATPLLRKINNDAEHWNFYLVVLFFVCLYGGYFGAGSGVMFLAVIAGLTAVEWKFSVLSKTIFMSIANLGASLIFVFFAPVDWIAVVIMFAGSIIGGYLGPTIQNYIPDTLSRVVISLGGFYLAWTLIP